MFRVKWYFHINLTNLSVIGYVPLPSHLGDVDISNFSDDQLSNLNFIGVNEGFMTEMLALSIGVSQEDLDTCKNNCLGSAIELHNIHKQVLIDAANHEDVNRAWGRFSDQERIDIVNYRQQLSEITFEDIFTFTWPAPPVVLVDFYRNK